MLRLCYNPAGITLHLFIVLKKRYLNLIKKSQHKQNPARFRRETKKAVAPEYYKPQIRNYAPNMIQKRK